MTARAHTVVVTGASAGVGRATAVAFAERGAAVALLARGAAGLAGATADVEAAGGRALPVPTDVADPKAVEDAAERVERELGPIDVWVNNAMTTVFARSWDVTAEEFQRATEVTYLGQVHGTLAALRRMRPRDRGSILNVGSALGYRAIPRQKVLGSFNTFLVLADKIAPGIVGHYVARTGVASQQTDLDADPDRPHDLWHPVDDVPGTDRGARGARGIFDSLEGGTLTRRWVGNLPRPVADVARAAGDRAREVVGSR